MAITAYQALDLLVGALTPISVGLLGFYVNSRVKGLEQEQWQNRKIVEKRIEFFEKVAPDLNALLCFYTWVGNWKELSPPQVIAVKRRLDKEFHVHRYLLGEDVFARYSDFVERLFTVFAGPGQDALIRAALTSELGDRTLHSNHMWEEKWRACFDEAKAVDRREIRRAYDALMASFQSAIGLSRDPPPGSSR
jgi:hypothetical protein